MFAPHFYQPVTPLPDGITLQPAVLPMFARFQEHCELSDEKRHRWYQIWRRAEQRRERQIGEAITAVHPDLGAVAFAQLINYPTRTEIADILVAARWRSKGIGRGMVGVLVGMAVEIGWRPLEISVETDNTRALSLYERIGFVRHRREDWVHMGGPPAITLRWPANRHDG